MTDIDLVLGLLASAGLLFYLGHRQRHGRDARRLSTANQALDGCANLLGLIRALQQHRGLSSGWLAGERGFEQRMLARRSEIERFIADLAGTAEAESAMPRPCFSPHDLALFRFQWRELAEQLPSLGIDQAIARHSALIAFGLEWLAALGEARVELTLPDRSGTRLVRNHASRLPMLAEYLGQMRALGSEVAARRHCSPVARVRLRYLAARAEMLLKEARAADRDSQTSPATAAVGELLAVVRREMLDGTAIEVTADAYFADASRAIDAVYVWIDTSATAVRAGLASRPAQPGLAPAQS
jgi:hypothetical protein